MLTCTVCGECYAAVGRDPYGWCDGCAGNFAGAPPPLGTPMRATAPLQPRQRETMRAMLEAWEREGLLAPGPPWRRVEEEEAC